METNGTTMEELRTMEAIQSFNHKVPEVKLRDLFAMHALIGLTTTNEDSASPEIWDYDMLAECAYKAADAMIKARKTK